MFVYFVKVIRLVLMIYSGICMWLCWICWFSSILSVVIMFDCFGFGVCVGSWDW